MSKKKKFTIYDVAEEAGVSRQTISRVLNNRPDVAPGTRKRVLEIIQKLDYQPSQLARGLSQGTSCTLGVVGYGIEYYGPSRTLTVVERQANAHGYSLTLSLTHEPEEININALLNNLVAQHVNGIIWAVPQIGDNRERLLDALGNHTTPIVCANMLPHPSFSLVDSDNSRGGKLAVQHLVEQGRQTIGIITGPSNWAASIQRYESWQTTLNSENLAVNEALVYEGDWTAQSGYQGLCHLLKNNPNMDAVFACNDQMALGVLKAAAELGKKIPEDIALVGYDNIPESEYFSSPLTTIRQNFSAQGQKIVEEIERRISEKKAGREDIPQVEILKPELIIRESSGAVPASST